MDREVFPAQFGKNRPHYANKWEAAATPQGRLSLRMKAGKQGL